MYPLALNYCLSVCSFQAKVEADRVCVLVGKKAGPEIGIKLRSRSSALSLAHRKDFTQLLQSIVGDGPALLLESNPKEFSGFQLAVLNKVSCTITESGSGWTTASSCLRARIVYFVRL